MKTAAIYALGEVPSFTLIPGDDMYWTERASYEISKNLANLAAADISFSVAEDTDFDQLESDIASFQTGFRTWLDTAYAAQEAGTPIPAPDFLPDIAGLVVALLSGGWSAVAPMLIKMGVDMLVSYVAKRIGVGGSADTDAIVDVLQKGLLKPAQGETSMALLHLEESDGNGGTVKYSIAEIIRKGLLSGGGGIAEIESILALALSQFRVEVVDYDGNKVLSFGLAPNEGEIAQP